MPNFKVRHPHQPSKLSGVRPDGDPWRRKGKPQRVLTNAQLVSALEWINTRASDRKRGARRWTITDQATTDELQQRAWGFGELQNLMLWAVPSWFSLLQLPRRGAGFERFLGFLLQAYRARAVGVLASYEEAMAMCGVRSRTTWRSWCAELEAMGLIRIVQTWRVNEAGKLCYGRLLYRLGPGFEQIAGPALCENALAAGDGASATWAKRLGIGLRKKARAARRETKVRLWGECRPELADLEAPAGELAGQDLAGQDLEAPAGHVDVEVSDRLPSPHAQPPHTGTRLALAPSGSPVSALQSGFAYGSPKRARQGAREHQRRASGPVLVPPPREPVLVPTGSPPPGGAGDEGATSGIAAFEVFLERLAASETADAKARQTASKVLGGLRKPASCSVCEGCGLMGGLCGETCEACGGSGVAGGPTSPREAVKVRPRSAKCPECRGAGEIGRPPFVYSCKRCKGSGRRASCKACGGTGCDHAGAPCSDCLGAG